MINQKHCPFCKTPAKHTCSHLALGVEARDFVRRCVELSQGQKPWVTLCNQRRELLRRTGDWSPEKEDFTWLETAFRDEFLRPLTWFGGMDHEWRTSPKTTQSGFWVILWSKDPQRLWWELRDQFERQSGASLSRSSVPKSQRSLLGAKPATHNPVIGSASRAGNPP
jgi:hypothetical protein